MISDTKLTFSGLISPSRCGMGMEWVYLGVWSLCPRCPPKKKVGTYARRLYHLYSSRG